MRRPLIIGQAPSAGSDPSEPLSGRSGDRLAELCGVQPSRFRRLFERVNLLDRYPGPSGRGKGDGFPIDEARVAAVSLLVSGALADRAVVMLGGNVAATFGLRGAVPQLRWSRVLRGGAGTRLAFCPHPSGVCRWWNDPENVEAARRFWTALAARRGA